MEQIDEAMAQRVWQRVQGQSPAPQESLTELMTRELEDGAAYLALSKRFQGSGRELLLQMYRQKQTNAACLRGMYLLENGARPAVSVPEPENMPIAMTLRRCYSREMAAATGYETRQAGTEYGKIFAAFASRAHDHCRYILELLGNLPKGAR